MAFSVQAFVFGITLALKSSALGSAGLRQRTTLGTTADHSMSQSLSGPVRRTSRKRLESRTALGCAVLVRLRLTRRLYDASGKNPNVEIIHRKRIVVIPML
jgi:hypothetical protein